METRNDGEGGADTKAEDVTRYYGRSVHGLPPYQYLRDHLAEVKNYAESFCTTFTQGEIGGICGILHDIGKYSCEFQRRVRGENISAPHSIAGAKIVYDYAASIMPTNRDEVISALTYYLLSYIIAGHHSGLPDFGSANANDATLYRRLQSAEVPDCSVWKPEIDLTFPQLAPFSVQHFTSKEDIGFAYFLYTHFLFSCLVDADRKSAADFPTPLPSPRHPTLSDMETTLKDYMDAFNSDDTELNAIRRSIRESCLSAAEKEPGVFTLTVPTGGGKTISSLSFALRHAVKYHLKRVIYTIPFTSIIEQNAAVYKKIFGEENVLEHHSNYQIPTQDGKDLQESLQMKLATGNWDAPLIVTTNVQFFESLFSANPSKSRKVHNIADSVIILDEVQALPRELLQPCMYALAELVKRYHCTVVLCTATQPDFHEHGILPIDRVTQIISNYPELATKMKRAEIIYKGKKSNEEIATMILNESQGLCIVNTKRHARELFELIRKETGCYHLSTNMYPAHRKKVIAEIRQRLKDGLTCRVVSTQLIEAGVDLDFPVVFRSIAGVDSIVQAAGRCNREMKQNMGAVYIFEPEQFYVSTGYLKQTAEITSALINEKKLKLDETLLLDECEIKQYFKELFFFDKDHHDDPEILSFCSNALSSRQPRYPFREISDRFKMIVDDGIAVVIPTAEARSLLDSLTETNLNYVQKMISPYCVNIREKQFQELVKEKKVHVEGEAFVILSNLTDYDSEIGLCIESC